MLVCLRINKRTESNTWAGHPALVGKSRQAVQAWGGNQRRPARTEAKKIGSANAYEFRFLVESFFVFITNTVLESIKLPHSVSF